MATNREKQIARRLLEMHRDQESQMADPDKHNREFEELAIKLALECLRTNVKGR